MTTLERLDDWKNTGTITPDQHGLLSALASGGRFSVYIELNALLYLGVLSIAGGIGWTVQTYFANLGDAAIVTTLTATLAACFYYCFSRANPSSPDEIESPNLAFDYVLYLGCVVFAIELGYLETRFEILRDAWRYYLLLSATLYLAFAYRFDNRFVLSLALSTLAGWFGVTLTRWGLASDDSLRLSALAYGIAVAVIGASLHRAGVKKHFFETYLHLSVNVLLASLLSGVAEPRFGIPYFAGLAALGAVAIERGIRYRRFAFVAYGTVFIYVGMSYKISELIGDSAGILFYGVWSSVVVLVLLVYAARKFGREE